NIRTSPFRAVKPVPDCDHNFTAPCHGSEASVPKSAKLPSKSRLGSQSAKSRGLRTAKCKNRGTRVEKIPANRPANRGANRVFANALLSLARGSVGYRSGIDRKSTRLNSSHLVISYAVFCLKKKK